MPIPKILITAGLFAANMALTMTRKIEGPRLDDLKFTSGDYGTPLPKVWGLRRISVPIFWAEDLREVKRRRKTKGGKFNEYSYYGTWAVALAGHEIDQVRRIWFDTHLIYDVSGAGPVTPFDFGDAPTGKGSGGAAVGGFSPAENIAIYYGSETQEPDPRILATTEERNGEGSAPAYRGTAYIVFKDVPLEKLGNRIPQVAVEIVTSSTNPWPYEETPIVEGGEQLLFSPDFSVLYSGGFYGMSVLDNAARAVISEIDGDFSGIGYRFAPMDGGNFIALEGGTDKPYLYDVYGGFSGPIVNIAMRNLSSAVDVDGDAHWITKARDTTTYYVDGTATGADLFGNQAFADLDGRIWMLSYSDSNTAEFRIVSGALTGVTVLTVPGLPSGTPGGAVHYRDDTTDRFVFSWDGDLYAIDTTTGAILDTYTAAHGEPSWRNIRPGVSTIWAGFYEISLADFSLVRSITPASAWGLAISATSEVIYDPINRALVRFASSGPQWLYLDRVGSSGVPLSEIMDDLAADCGVVDYDFSDLTQIVKGWSATNGQASNMAEPLLDAFDSEVRPHGFTFQGIKRAGVSGGSILTEYFVGEPRYSVKVRQAAELPRSLTIGFADMDAEQQVNNVRCDRPLDATGARSERQLDLQTLATDADEARRIGDRYFRRIWNERREVTLSLTAQQLALEPGDCRTLSLDGESDIYRCVSVSHKADDTLETEWRYDHPSLAVLGNVAGAPFDGRNPDVVVVPLLSRGFVLDIPLLQDVDSNSNPLLYMGAAPAVTGTWPGATIYEAIDGEYSDEVASVASSSATVWGTTTDTLGDANPNLWDRLSTVNVSLQYGTLTGTTEAAIDADPTRNLMLIGDELVNFTTATLEMDGTYTLSGFKRGRRGTEWATATHGVRDVVLLCDALQDIEQGLSEVGTNLSFKAITAGRSTGFPIDIEPFSGASLKPYAPCHLNAALSGSDWVLTWVRRTRVGGAWTSGTTIPLSEASEEYEVEIMDGSTVKRTFTGLSSPTVTYTSAQQTTDFGAPLSSAPTFRVYQISASVDRGFVATSA